MVLSPNFFLPSKCRLRTYPQSARSKEYAIADDGVLREFPAHNDSSQFLPFAFDTPRKFDELGLNPLLVILNADIKFRQYRRHAGARTLHPNYEALVKMTLELAELLYFQPVAAPGTAGARFAMGSRRDVNGATDPKIGIKGADHWRTMIDHGKPTSPSKRISQFSSSHVYDSRR